MTARARAPWDRRDREPSRAYGAFRLYRDAGPLRTLAKVAAGAGIAERTARRWSADWDWPARAIAWDDEVHRLEDRRRLEQIRSMHRQHSRAGRAARAKALAALRVLEPADLTASEAARLLELGARLERETLTVSVEQLQGAMPAPAGNDPWDAIAAELAAEPD